MKLKSFITKNGDTVSLGKVTVFVGPNNSGKSQTLRDIRERMVNGLKSKPIIISQFNFEISQTPAGCFENIIVKDSVRNIGFKTISGLQSDLLSQDTRELYMQDLERSYGSGTAVDFILNNLSLYSVTNLDSATRLKLVNSTPSFNPNKNNPSNLLQSLFLNKQDEEILIDAFKDAFNMDIKLDYSELTTLCLRVAKNLPFIPDDPQQAYLITRDLNEIDTQGDGFKSFVGIILGLLFSKKRVILLDEPEAFLHPAQARFLGKWIIDHSDILDGQLLICTHNSNFLSGVLSSDKKVDVYRLNRTDDITKYNLLPSEATDRLTKSPILSSQRVIEGIFHKGVVVCEADADRAVYQSVASIECNSNQEILFIHSHNKQTHKDVAKLLYDAKIPVVLIADIDIFNGESDLKNILDALGCKQERRNILLDKREKISNAINIDDNMILQNIIEKIKEFMLQLENKEHQLTGAKSAYKRIEKEFSSWKDIKEKGIKGFSNDIQDNVKSLIDDLKSEGVFVVPVGELEGWIDVGTRRKNKWIIPALNKIHSGKSPEVLKTFVKEVLNYF